MQKIKYLDGIRGLAALMVVFHHFILAFYPALFFGENATPHLPGNFEVFASGSLLNLFYNGNFAVCIFFMLSGFVLSWKFFVQKDYEVVVASAVKRYFRLVFPVAFSVLVAFVFMKYSLFYNQQAGELVGSGWLGSFWTFTADFKDAFSQAFYGVFSDAYYYNTVLWTIAYEFWGAFLIFGFLLVFGKNKYRYLFYVPFMLFFLQTYYLAFMLGMLLSDLSANKKLILYKADRFKLLRLLLVGVGLYIGSYPSGRAVDGTIYTGLHFVNLDTLPLMYHVAGAFLVTLVLLDSKIMQSFFSNKYFLILGELSFAMYLLHFIVLGSFASWVFLKLEPVLSYAAAFWLTLGASLPLILLLSWLMHQTIDKYTFGFSQFVYEKIFKRIVTLRFSQPKSNLMPE